MKFQVNDETCIKRLISEPKETATTRPFFKDYKAIHQSLIEM